VALLAKRGHCTFQTKARVAASYAKVHHVKFVIVYNDVGRHELITMKADGTRMKGLPVGLVSVSNESGESTYIYILTLSLSRAHAFEYIHTALGSLSEPLSISHIHVTISMVVLFLSFRLLNLIK
jgi:hypothetical protein